MIALIGNRPVIQVGNHQVTFYDSQWLQEALCSAAQEANQSDFPFVDEISRGIFHYLENKCELRLLPLSALYDKMRKMLQKLGFASIAEALRPIAPPIKLSLKKIADDTDAFFEMAFFDKLRKEILELRQVGAWEIRLLHLRSCVMQLCGTQKWNKQCAKLQNEIEEFVRTLEPKTPTRLTQTVTLHMADL